MVIDWLINMSVDECEMVVNRVNEKFNLGLVFIKRSKNGMPLCLDRYACEVMVFVIKDKDGYCVKNLLTHKKNGHITCDNNGTPLNGTKIYSFNNEFRI